MSQPSTRLRLFRLLAHLLCIIWASGQGDILLCAQRACATRVTRGQRATRVAPNGQSKYFFGTLSFRDLIYGLEFEIETDFDENAKMQVDFVD